MAKAAASPELKTTFNRHLDQTREQVKRLDRIFDELGRRPRAKNSKGMEGLLEEEIDLMEQPIDPGVKDVSLIMAAQRVEHYEMAGYRTARTLAKLLGFDDAADALQQTLEEEDGTSRRLTQLAETIAKPETEGESGEEEDEEEEEGESQVEEEGEGEYPEYGEETEIDEEMDIDEDLLDEDEFEDFEEEEF
jgi:ferritin-like metal-binding protein YciE